MDNQRFIAISALFNPDSEYEPAQLHVNTLIDHLELEDDEENDLADFDLDAYTNFKEYLLDPEDFIRNLGGITRRKVFLQRLTGLPEDPMPDAIIERRAGMQIDDPNDLVLDDDEEVEDDEEVDDADVIAPKDVNPPNDDIVPPRHEQVAGTPTTLGDVAKPAETQSTQAATSCRLIPPVIRPLRRHELPPYLLAVLLDERWELYRQKIEQAFHDSQSQDLDTRSQGERMLLAWKIQMQDYMIGACDPSWKDFGFHMLDLIDSLKNGADPTSENYLALFAGI